MKATWKVSLLFERRIEMDGRMVNAPFVQLKPVSGEGDMYFTVPGGVVEYAPEKVDVREAANGTIVKHKVIDANTLALKVTSVEGVEWRQGTEVTIDLTPQ
jgi:hypothetical protein